MPGSQSKPATNPVPITSRELIRILRRHAPYLFVTPRVPGQQGQGAGQSGNVSIYIPRRLISSATAPTANNQHATTTQFNNAATVAINSTLTSTSKAPSNLPVLGIGRPTKATFVNPKRLGNYLVEQPLMDKMPVETMQAFICKKMGVDGFYLIKTLILTPEEAEMAKAFHDHQGNTLLHTELLLLTILKDVPGVVQEHGIFLHKAFEDGVTEDGQKIISEVSRMCLVLDCFVGHDSNMNLTNLLLYVIKHKKIGELDALRLFFKMLTIVERIHKKNVVHRDLKLANFVLDTKSGEIYLTNFLLGKLLMSETELLKDQRGSPGYIAPEIVRATATAYLAKPCDMWALGVILFTMLHGRFPFYDREPAKLFQKIEAADLEIPIDSIASEDTISLIKALLSPDPQKRPTVSEALSAVRNLLDNGESQVVPVRPSADPEPDRRELEGNQANKRELQMQPSSNF